jgi:hypothetical protein
MAAFELWNAESGNLLGAFSTESEALAAVREAIERNGPGYGQILTLGRENSRDRSRILASGQQLVEQALAQPREPSAARRWPN